MKKIECVIRPFKLEKVQEALNSVGVRNMTVSEIRKFRRSHGHTDLYPINEHMIEHTIEVAPKLRIEIRLSIEIVVPNKDVDKVLEVVKQAAATDNILLN